jgi:hypothetical protein
VAAASAGLERWERNECHSAAHEIGEKRQHLGGEGKMEEDDERAEGFVYGRYADVGEAIGSRFMG